MARLLSCVVVLVLMVCITQWGPSASLVVGHGQHVPHAEGAHMLNPNLGGQSVSDLERMEQGAERARQRMMDGDMESSVPRTAPEVTTTCEPKLYDFGSYSYCGANSISVDTYVVPTTSSGEPFKLRSLQLVARHGDRSPVNILPYYDVAYEQCDNTATLGVVVGGGKVQQSGSMKRRRPLGNASGFRMMEEHPWMDHVSITNPFAQRLWQGNCMTGQLTARGQEQLQEIGAAMRSVYVDKLGYLPQTYSRKSTSFFLRSTDVWRTRQSAQSLLSGLWPVSEEELAKNDPIDSTIPFYSFPQEVETMYNNAAACDALAKLQHEMQNESAWKKHLDVPQVWAELDRVMGIGGMATFHSTFGSTMDNFYTRQCHDLPLPCARNNRSDCIQQELADFVYGQGDWEYQYLYNASPRSKQLARLGISAFMAVIRDTLIARATGSDEAPDFVYYSGHDSTIGPVLGALNITGFRWPPYASNMLFELWQDPSAVDGAADHDAASSLSVRVVYNGVTLPIYAAGCCEDLCPFSQFVDYLNSIIPENLVELCSGSKDETMD